MAGIDASDTAYVAGLVRERDRPRYFATLFAPVDLRRDLFALYGFAAEIERIPHLVSSPGLGEIRLQWWADAIDGLVKGGTSGEAHPALRELAAAAARRALPFGPLADLIEARRSDLYADAPESVSAMEGYFGETQSALFQLACLIAGGSGAETADAAGHAGVAYGLARTLAHAARDGATGRSLAPLDLLRAEGLVEPDVFAAPTPQALAGIHDRMAAIARAHLAAAQTGFAGLPARLRAVFLPLATTKPLLRRIAARSPAVADEGMSLSDLESLVRLAHARLLLGRLHI